MAVKIEKVTWSLVKRPKNFVLFPKFRRMVHQLRTLVRSLRRKQEEGLEAALWREADAQAHCYSTHDMHEGLKASIERRAPRFEQYESYGNPKSSL
ncbi:3-hydroxybutyryl-CoA dehydratase-like protein [Durusdinium trenchii]|uniref:Mitochondrial n=1 Tax=Durusdinium trenchii TaxID=1381693 RepID=A0ABP0I6U0_9DINO